MAEPLGTLYLQVADHLRRSIARGDLAIGDPIPSTSRLCEQFGVSATVTRAAVKQLQAAGLVRGQPGKAVYVISTPDKVEQASVDLHQVADEVGRLRGGLTALSDRVGSIADVEALRSDVDDLRRQVATLQGHLIDLYSRTGHSYPHDAKTTTAQRRPVKGRRKAAGG